VILTTATVAIYYGYTSSAAKAKRDADIPVLTDKSLETFHPTKMAEPATKDSTTIVRKLSVKIPPPSTSPEEPAKDAEADAASPEEQAEDPASPAEAKERGQLSGDIRGLDRPETWVSGGSSTLDKAMQDARQDQPAEGPIGARATTPASKLAWAGITPRQPRSLDSRQAHVLSATPARAGRSNLPMARNPATSASSPQNAIGMNTGSGGGAAYAGGQPAGDRLAVAGGGAIPMPGPGGGGIAGAGGGGGGGAVPKYVAQKTLRTINGEAVDILALAGSYHSTVVKKFVDMEEADIPPICPRVDDAKTKLAALKSRLDNARKDYTDTGKPLKLLEESAKGVDELRTMLDNGNSAIRDILGQEEGRTLGLFSLGGCQKSGAIMRSRLAYYPKLGYEQVTPEFHHNKRRYDEDGYALGEPIYSANYYAGCQENCAYSEWDYQCSKITWSQETYVGQGTNNGQPVQIYRETYSCIANVGLAAMEDHQKLAAGMKKIANARNVAESLAPDVPAQYAAAAEGLDPARAAKFNQLGADMRSTLEAVAALIPSNLRATPIRDATSLRAAAEAGRQKISAWDQHFKDESTGYPQGQTLNTLHHRMADAVIHAGSATSMSIYAGSVLYKLAEGGSEATNAYVELCESQDLLKTLAQKAPNY
jgi:hypothetical protein